MTKQLVSEQEAKVQRRIECVSQILSDAAADGLIGYDASRPEDLVVRDVSEFIMLKNSRKERIVQNDTQYRLVPVKGGNGVVGPT